MADAITTIAKQEYSSGVKVHTITMTCATAASAFTSANIGGEQGKQLVNIFTKAGSTGPTADSDLAITDSITGLNLASIQGTDSVDNSGQNYVIPNENSMVIGPLVVAVTNNSVNNAETTITLVFKSKDPVEYGSLDQGFLELESGIGGLQLESDGSFLEFESI